MIPWIVTEDSVSGYKFWLSVAKSHGWYYPDLKNVVSAGSITAMTAKVGQVMRRITASPKLKDVSGVYCALDNIGKAYMAIDDIMEQSITYGIPVRFTEAYTFETMFASYDSWEETCPTVIKTPQTERQKAVFDMMKYIQEQYKKHKAVVFQPNMPVYAAYCRIIKGTSPRNVFTSTENIITEVLNLYTGRGIFSVGSKTITLCWLTPCGGHGKTLFCPYVSYQKDSPSKRNYFWSHCNDDWICQQHSSLLQFRTHKDKIDFFAEHSVFGRELQKLYDLAEGN